MVGYAIAQNEDSEYVSGTLNQKVVSDMVR